MLLLISSICPGQTQGPEGFKAVLTVEPEPSQIFRGEIVTLTCYVQGEGWRYRWQCDGNYHNIKEKEIKITADHTQMCWCYGCRGSGSGSGSDCSHWSDEVTLNVLEKPKAVLTVKPEPSQIFRGDTVTLTCDVPGEGWGYRWECDGKDLNSNEKEFNTTADRTQICRCKGCRRPGCSHWSEVTLTVSEKPKAVLTVEPEPSQIFRGETVTLTCDVPGEGWGYIWQCDGKYHISNEKEFKITADHTQMYRCYGCRGSGSGSGSGFCSYLSDEVTLTVSERPKAVLTVKPEPSQIFRGDTVTLTCDVQGEGWTYGWQCDGKDLNSNEKEIKITADHTQMYRCSGCRRPGCSHWSEVTLTVSEKPKAVLTVEPEPSEIFRGETVTLTCDVPGEGWGYRWECDGRDHNSKEKEFKITADHTQMCRCYSCRGSGSGFCSHWSDEVTLTVSGKPRVTVKPQSSVFTGDTVTLSCDVGRSTGRRIIWYKNSERIKAGDETNTLRDVRVSDGGDYRCGVENLTRQGQRVTLTVRERPKAVLRVHPDGRVFRGETVTLTCDIQETDVTHWIYTWNKDHSEIHASQSQEYRISSVNESHTGHYSCRGREKRGSRHTHTSDEVTLTLSAGSPALMTGLIAGLSVSFMLIFLLVLLWCCKHNKGGGSLSPSTDHQQHNSRQTEEQKKSEQTPQQSDPDVTYTEIGLKSMNEIKKNKENKDTDVTYSEIDLKSVKDMKKKKEKKGKTSESSDTVYSKLKIGTG